MGAKLVAAGSSRKACFSFAGMWLSGSTVGNLSADSPDFDFLGGRDRGGKRLPMVFLIPLHLLHGRLW